MICDVRAELPSEERPQQQAVSWRHLLDRLGEERFQAGCPRRGDDKRRRPGACRIPPFHLAPEAGPDGAAAVYRLQAEGGGQHWSTVLAQAKQLGEVRVHACSLSMDLLGLATDDLDPLVDDVEGVTAFMLTADGQLVFI